MQGLPGHNHILSFMKAFVTLHFIRMGHKISLLVWLNVILYNLLVTCETEIMPAHGRHVWKMPEEEDAPESSMPCLRRSHCSATSCRIHYSLVSLCVSWSWNCDHSAHASILMAILHTCIGEVLLQVSWYPRPQDYYSFTCTHSTRTWTTDIITRAP